MAAGEVFALLALSWPAITISLIEMAARWPAARRSAKATARGRSAAGRRGRGSHPQGNRGCDGRRHGGAAARIGGGCAGCGGGDNRGAAAGEVSPDEAVELTRLVEGFVKVVEISDIERRLCALEEAAAR